MFDLFEARSEPPVSDFRLPVPPLLTERADSEAAASERELFFFCLGRERDDSDGTDDDGGTDAGGKDDAGDGKDDAGGGKDDGAAGG